MGGGATALLPFMGLSAHGGRCFSFFDSFAQSLIKRHGAYCVSLPLGAYGSNTVMLVSNMFMIAIDPFQEAYHAVHDFTSHSSTGHQDRYPAKVRVSFIDVLQFAGFI